jgi:adenylate kinase
LVYCSEGAQKKKNFSGVIDDIAEHYKIPILNIKNILQKALQEAEADLIVDLKEEIENIQNYLSSDKPESLNETLKVLYRTVKWRLSQNDCRNRGYILEDFPKFNEEAKFVFEKSNNNSFVSYILFLLIKSNLF